MHNPLDMLVFAKVVELKSFSMTARRLGISRSAASKHVTRLEQALGARLLNRTTRKLSLTEPGHAAYTHCARIAAEVEASELSVQRFVSRPKGLLRVSAPSAFGRSAPRADPAGIPHPPSRCRDRSGPERPARRPGRGALRHRDPIIPPHPREPDPARYRPDPVGGLRGAGLLAEVPRRRGSPDDLRKHNCIFYASTAVRGDAWTLSRKGETTRVTVNGNFRANNSEAVRDAAVRGLGLALLPTFAMWQDLKTGTLVRVLPDWTAHGTFGSSLTAYFIADRQLTPKIRTLVDFLAERFGKSPAWDRGIATGATPNPR